MPDNEFFNEQLRDIARKFVKPTLEMNFPDLSTFTRLIDLRDLLIRTMRGFDLATNKDSISPGDMIDFLIDVLDHHRGCVWNQELMMEKQEEEPHTC